MAAPMTTDQDPVPESWIPEDTFRHRLGLIRVALGGLNIKEAAELCDLNPENWRRWEDGAGSPRDLEGVCQKIHDHTGLDYRWLIGGGPLRTGSFSPGLLSLPQPTGQGSLLDEDDDPFDFWSRPKLSSVFTS